VQFGLPLAQGCALVPMVMSLKMQLLAGAAGIAVRSHLAVSQFVEFRIDQPLSRPSLLIHQRHDPGENLHRHRRAAYSQKSV
jgi:hypothetical protein